MPNAMKGAASIAQAKPYMADRIAAQILRVEKGAYDTAECRNVAIGHAIQSLDRFGSRISDRLKIQFFVARQLKNRRVATRGKAERFLKKWPIAQGTPA